MSVSGSVARGIVPPLRVSHISFDFVPSSDHDGFGHLHPRYSSSIGPGFRVPPFFFHFTLSAMPLARYRGGGWEKGTSIHPFPAPSAYSDIVVVDYLSFPSLSILFSRKIQYLGHSRGQKRCRSSSPRDSTFLSKRPDIAAILGLNIRRLCCAKATQIPQMLLSQQDDGFLKLPRLPLS